MPILLAQMLSKKVLSILLPVLALGLVILLIYHKGVTDQRFKVEIQQANLTAETAKTQATINLAAIQSLDKLRLRQIEIAQEVEDVSGQIDAAPDRHAVFSVLAAGGDRMRLAAEAAHAAALADSNL